VRTFADLQEYRAFIERVEQIFDRATITELLRAVDAHFGETYFGLDSLLPEQREEVLDALFHELTDHFAELYTRLYQENRRAVNALADTGLKIPREFRIAAEYTLSRQLNAEVRKQRGSLARESYRRALEVGAEARHRGYQLDLTESARHFGAMLETAVQRLTGADDGAAEACQQAADVIELSELLALELPLDRAQELLFDRLRDPEAGPRLRAIGAPLVDLVEKMRLAPRIL
jgi:hypothetical protein